MHPGEPSHRLLGRWPGCNRGHILTKLESRLFMATGRFRAISTPPQGWLMQSRSTRAARTRFQGRARRRRQSAAPSSWSKSNRFWLGHASSQEIVVTSSDSISDGGYRSRPHETHLECCGLLLSEEMATNSAACAHLIALGG